MILARLFYPRSVTPFDIPIPSSSCLLLKPRISRSSFRAHVFPFPLLGGSSLPEFELPFKSRCTITVAEVLSLLSCRLHVFPPPSLLPSPCLPFSLSSKPPWACLCSESMDERSQSGPKVEKRISFVKDEELAPIPENAALSKEATEFKPTIEDDEVCVGWEWGWGGALGSKGGVACT